jgi:hypothetical protein
LENSLHNKFGKRNLWKRIKNRIRPVRYWYKYCQQKFGSRPFSSPETRAKFKMAFENHSRIQHLGNQPAQGQVEKLRKQGYLFVGKDNQEIQFRNDIAVNLVKYIEKDPVYNPNSKQYLKHLNPMALSGDDRELIYKFMAQDYFLNLATQYLGEYPLLVELKVLISPAIEKSEYSGSQLWHSDFDDEKNLKIFHFLKDVDIECGPLQALSKEKSQKIMDDRGFVWGSNISHDDSLVNENDQLVETCTGVAGDTILIDTVNCLHRGSRSNRKPRYILYATYNTRSSFRFPPYHKLLPWKYSSINEFTVPLIDFDPEMAFLKQEAVNI